MVAYELLEMHNNILAAPLTAPITGSPSSRDSPVDQSSLGLSGRSKTELSPEAFEQHDSFYTGMYHVTPDGELLASPAALKALSEMVKAFRWLKRGTHITFTRYTMASSYASRSAGSGHKTLSVHDDHFAICEAEDEATAMTESSDVISRFMMKVYSALFVGCAIECPDGFFGRERSRVGDKCYFITLDPLQKFGRILAKYGAHVRPDVLTELLYSFEDNLCEGLAMTPKPTLSWLFYEKTAHFSFALCSASSKNFGPSPSLKAAVSGSPPELSALQRQVATLQAALGKRKSPAPKGKGGGVTAPSKVAAKDDGTGRRGHTRQQGGDSTNPFKCNSTKEGHGKHSYCHMNHSALA